jgi:hypothetical protein
VFELATFEKKSIVEGGQAVRWEGDKWRRLLTKLCTEPANGIGLIGGRLSPQSMTFATLYFLIICPLFGNIPRLGLDYPGTVRAPPSQSTTQSDIHSSEIPETRAKVEWVCMFGCFFLGQAGFGSPPSLGTKADRQHPLRLFCTIHRNTRQPPIPVHRTLTAGLGTRVYVGWNKI